MKQIDISRVLTQAWELTKKHFLLTVVIIFGIGAIQYLVSSIFSVSNAADMMSIIQNPKYGKDPDFTLQSILDICKGSSISNIVSLIVKEILSIGLFNCLLISARGNNGFKADSWSLPVNTYIFIFVTEIIVCLISVVGYVLCILPGIYLRARLKYCTLYLIDHKEASITEAISASWNMTSDNALMLSLLEVINRTIIWSGYCYCYVGHLPAEAIVDFSIVVCYLTLAPEQPSNPRSEVM